MKVVRYIFVALALTVSEILTLDSFNLQKVGQGHIIQLSQCCRSMENIKIYKSRPPEYLR